MKSKEAETNMKVEHLVLDAGPLITIPFLTIKQFSDNLYTTPGVIDEIKDEKARSQLEIWKNDIKVRHPKSHFVQIVQRHANITGNNIALSVNDINVIALALELDMEKNKARKLLENSKTKTLKNMDQETCDVQEVELDEQKDVGGDNADKNSKEQDEFMKGDKIEVELLEHKSSLSEKKQIKDDSFDSNNETTNISFSSTQKNLKKVTPPIVKKKINKTKISSFFNDETWITMDNLLNMSLSDKNKISMKDLESSQSVVFFATSDFTCQNLSLKLGLKLISLDHGKMIKLVKSFMQRCFACFYLIPIKKDNSIRHFCPKCGNNTLTRCSVSTDKKGNLIPHLSSKYKIRKNDGLKISVSINTKKNTNLKKNKNIKKNTHMIYTEDQKEYQYYLKHHSWLKKKTEKQSNEINSDFFYEDIFGTSKNKQKINSF